MVFIVIFLLDELYDAILRVIRVFASRTETALLNGNIDGLYKSIHVLITDNVEIANDLDEEEDSSDEDAYGYGYNSDDDDPYGILKILQIL